MGFIIKESKSSLLKKANVSYLGGIKHSAKMAKSYKNGTVTYCLYLAPSTMSGYNTCPNAEYCKDFCLNESGRAKFDILAHGGIEHSRINNARIKKTKLFYEDRETFMKILILEIRKAKQYAKNRKMNFSIRLNGTSDLSPSIFKYKGKSILDIFPHTQFYDYTKVYSRTKMLYKHSNYDITLSFNGHNWDECEEYLNNDGKVAVVFENEIPKMYKGYKVINANDYDMRYIDPKGTIMGLTYHRTANDYKNGHFEMRDTKFIVRNNDIGCAW